MSESNPYEGLSFDAAIKEFIEDCKKNIRLNYSIRDENMGSWFRGKNTQRPLDWQIKFIAQKYVFANDGKNKDWVTKWVHAMEVMAANKDATIGDVTSIVDYWEEYYKNSN